MMLVKILGESHIVTWNNDNYSAALWKGERISDDALLARVDKSGELAVCAANPRAECLGYLKSFWAMHDSWNRPGYKPGFRGNDKPSFRGWLANRFK